MSPNPEFSVDLVILTEEILNGKLIFLSSHEKVFFNLSNKEFANVCD